MSGIRSFQNCGVRRENVLKFLVFAHIGNGAFDISIQKKPTDLYSSTSMYNLNHI